MAQQKILFVGGSLNQTSMLHKISKQLDTEFDVWFSPFYADGFIRTLADAGLLDFTILGGEFRRMTDAYFLENNIKIDYRGEARDYDLVVICSDLIVPDNIAIHPKVVLIQEGMTDPENVVYHIVKKLKLPRWIASTSTTGLSHKYTKFCVASEGYKEHFMRKGIPSNKLIVTGIPNFDNCAEFLKNDFPYKDYVLVASSDARETFKYENRKKFIEKALRIADGRQVIFKFHPNEKADRAFQEVEEYAPGAIAFHKGNVNEMIANCQTLITRFSTVVYVGIALGKEVFSEFDVPTLKKMAPMQNGGTSANAIADVCREVLDSQDTITLQKKAKIYFFGKKLAQTG